MNDLVTIRNGTPATTQSIIAQYSENTEKSIQQLIRTHISSLEKFGAVEFDTVSTNGRPQKLYYLNEQQSYLFMTFLKNTSNVIAFKERLIKEFFDLHQNLQIGQEQFDRLKETIISQNAQIAQLLRELENKQKRLPAKPTDENLKRVLIRVHDGYHRILTTCSPLEMIDELRKMTNMFQLIGSIKNNGNNLNTDTVAGHLYWR